VNRTTAPVDTKKIRFVASQPWLTEGGPPRPGPIIKTLPEWYRKADRYVIDPATGRPWERPDGQGKVPTWKACPAVFDIMGSGYAYKTPCDIEFAENAGDIQAKVLDSRYESFLTNSSLTTFPAPPGHHAKPFAWWPDWAAELPEGYSALYMQPANRFELPFLTLSGVVDNDTVRLSVTMPFFVRRGYAGVLPAGTPYAQVLPFKKEHWEAEVDVSLPHKEMSAKNLANSAKFRQPDGGVYISEVWERRKYT
jgi:hypothetical protein